MHTRKWLYYATAGWELHRDEAQSQQQWAISLRSLSYWRGNSVFIFLSIRDATTEHTRLTEMLAVCSPTHCSYNASKGGLPCAAISVGYQVAYMLVLMAKQAQGPRAEVWGENGWGQPRLDARRLGLIRPLVVGRLLAGYISLFRRQSGFCRGTSLPSDDVAHRRPSAEACLSVTMLLHVLCIKFDSRKQRPQDLWRQMSLYFPSWET